MYNWLFFVVNGCQCRRVVCTSAYNQLCKRSEPACFDFMVRMLPLASRFYACHNKKSRQRMKRKRWSVGIIKPFVLESRSEKAWYWLSKFMTYMYSFPLTFQAIALSRLKTLEFDIFCRRYQWVVYWYVYSAHFWISGTQKPTLIFLHKRILNGSFLW